LIYQNPTLLFVTLKFECVKNSLIKPVATVLKSAELPLHCLRFYIDFIALVYHLFAQVAGHDAYEHAFAAAFLFS
jgi:hypothetical protein